MKSNALATILTITITTLITTTTTTYCGPSCMTCFNFNNVPKCHLCYLSELTKSQKCSIHAPDPVYNCLVFGQAACEWCKSGYAETYPGSGICKEAQMPTNCLHAVIVDLKLVCRTCENGYPSLNGKKCEPKESVKGAIDGCVWGGRTRGQEEVMCYRCEDQLAVNSEGGGCVDIGFEGCLQASVVGCEICDGFAGYYMKDFKCVKARSGLVM
jgi:hypothetical protein